MVNVLGMLFYTWMYFGEDMMGWVGSSEQLIEGLEKAGAKKVKG